MSEVKREFEPDYELIDDPSDQIKQYPKLTVEEQGVARIWYIRGACDQQEKVMSWHEQEMERMGAAYDGVSSRHRELMNDFNRVADSKSHLSSQVLEQQLKIESLTAMLDKMEKALEYYAFNTNDCLTGTSEEKIAREALKELADFRGSK